MDQKSAAEVQRIIDSNEPSIDIKSEAFKYWIHCNSCYEIYTKKRYEMYLLSCHHILCGKCISKETDHSKFEPNESNKKYGTYKCSKCLRSVRARALGNDMPRHLKELFHPHPWVDDVPTVRIFKFQSKQREHVLNGVKNIEKKVFVLQNTALELSEQVQKSREDLQKLIHENTRLERRVRPFIAIFKQRKKMKLLEKSKLCKTDLKEKSIVHFSNGTITTEAKTMMPKLTSYTRHHGSEKANSWISNNKSDEMKNIPVPENNSKVTSFLQSRPNNSFYL